MTIKPAAILRYLFFLGIGVFFIMWSLKDLSVEDKSQITIAIHQGRFWLVVPGIIVMLLSHWIRALRWRLLMEPLGYRPALLNTFFAVMVGYLANQAVPRLGELLRCSTLTKYEKIPLDKLLGTVIIERIIDVVSLFCLFVILLIARPDLYQHIFNTFFPGQVLNNKYVLLLYFLLIVVLLVGIIFLLLLLFKKRSAAFFVKIKNFMQHLWQGIITIGQLQHRIAFLLLTILLWSLYIASVFIGFAVLRETQSLGLTEAIGVLSAGTIGMIITPGGIGAYAFLVQKVMALYDINSGIGLTLGWLLWLLQTGAVFFAGILSLIGLPIYNKTKK